MLAKRRDLALKLASAALVILGCLVLVGWAFQIPLLTSILPDQATTKANMAIGIVLMGVVFWLLSDEQPPPRARSLATLGASGVFLIGLLTLLEYVLGWNLGIDQFLFHDPALVHPGRMAEVTAISLTLLGLALGLLTNSKWFRLMQSLALAVLGIALLTLVGYLYQVQQLYTVFSFSSVALSTAVALLIASLGVLFARPEQGLMAALSADRPGGLMARRLLPALIVVPIIFGWLQLRGYEQGLYANEFGLGLLVLSNIGLVGVLIWWNANLLNREDVKRQQTETALIASEKRYHQVLDQLMEGAQIIGFDWRYLYVNDAAARHGSQLKENMLGALVPELFPGVETTKLFQVLQTCMAARTTDHLETQFTFPDGRVGWFELSIQPVPEGLFILTLDITERKQAELRLRASEERFRLLLESAPQAIVLVDDQGQIRLTNAQAAKVFGYSRAEMQDQVIEMLLPERVSNQHNQHRAKYAVEPSMRILGTGPDFIGRRKDGSEFPIDLALSAIETTDGLLLTAFVRDITERKRIETALSHYVQRMEILHEIDRGIAEARSAEVLIDATLRRLQQLIPCQRASVGVIDNKRSTVNFFTLNFEADRVLRGGGGSPLPADFFDGFDERHLRLVNDFRLESDLRAYKLVSEGLLSGLTVLFVDQQRPFGTLELLADTPNFFTAEYQEIVVDIASQVGIAVHQFYLKEELAARASQLEQQVDEIAVAEAALQEANLMLERRVEERTEELFAAKERAEAVLNNSLDGILLVDTDLRIRQTNRAFNQLFACEDDDYFNQPLRNLLHVDSVAEMNVKAEATTIPGQLGKYIEVKARRKNGTVFDAELSFGQIKQDGFVCTLRDISERKQQERQLRYFASLQDSVSDSVISTDLDFRIQSWNQAAERIYGWKAEEVIGKVTFDVLQTQYTSPTEREERIQALREQGWWQGEVTQYHRSGRLLYILGSITLIKDERNVPVAVVSVNHDITESKLAEQALMAKMQEEAEFQTYLKALHDITIELTQIDELDEFYRRAVQLGMERLGFERLGVLLHDPETGLAVGTYGTDPTGKMVAEHDLRLHPSALTGILMRTFEQAERFIFDEHVSLYYRMQEIGVGWNAAAILWNGMENLGWLAADNAVEHGPASKSQLEIFALYALTLGTLLVQKQGQAALRESEEHFRLLLHAAPNATIISDQSGRIVLINTQAETLFGYNRAELIGQSVEVLVPDYARSRHVHHRSTYVAAPHVRQMGPGSDLFARRKDGSEFPVEIDLGFIETKQGLLVMSFVIDITERLGVVAAMEQQRLFLQNIIDVSPNLIYVKDYQSRFILANPMVASAHSTTLNELIGKTQADFSTAPQEVMAFMEADRRVIESGEPLYLEEPITLASGEMRWLQTTKVPIVSGDGKSRHVLGVSTDITEHKLVAETLRQAFEKEHELSELKSRFVSMASHEFRTPLATILALTETLSAYRHKLPEADIDMRFDKIKDQIAHLKDIMDDVLQLARLQARRAEFVPARVDLDGMCRSVLDEFEYLAATTHTLVYACDEALCDVYLDKKLMRQIINNLVSNAFKYSPAGKTVTVRLDYIDHYLVLKVSDEGIGIPEKDLKHLFEPFHRADNVGTIAGTGLGLVITKESVELHGGTILVESAEGLGTTFTVAIPLTLKEEMQHGEDTGY